MDNIQELCKKILKGAESFDNIVNSEREKSTFCRNTNDFELELLPQDVINFLQLYLLNKKTDDEVKNWALFILMSGAFSTPNVEEDCFHYDLLWTIVGELYCPEIDGKLTKDRTLNYMTELKKL